MNTVISFYVCSRMLIIPYYKQGKEMELIAIVTVLILIQTILFGFEVGKARGKYKKLSWFNKRFLLLECSLGRKRSTRDS